MTDLLTDFKTKREEIGAKALAAALGISESSVRSICTGHYDNPGKILNSFAVQFINPECPFTQAPITREDCDAHALTAKPFGGPTKRAWWDACQTCPYKGKRL